MGTEQRDLCVVGSRRKYNELYSFLNNVDFCLDTFSLELSLFRKRSKLSAVKIETRTLLFILTT